MKSIIWLLLFTVCSLPSFAQNNRSNDGTEFLKNAARRSCECIDSIEDYDKSPQQLSADIGKCIKAQVRVYQLARKLLDALNVDSILADKPNSNNQIDITLNSDEDSL